MSGANAGIVFPDTVGKPEASRAALLDPPSGKPSHSSYPSGPLTYADHTVNT